MTFEKRPQFVLHPSMLFMPVDATSTIPRKGTSKIAPPKHGSPISSLPAELLLEVFKICVLWCYDRRKPRHRLAWTHVCRLWRNIALSSPLLWQSIDLCDIHLAREFIIRSNGAPVSIVSSMPANFHAFNLNDLKINSALLTKIDVILFPDDMATFIGAIGTRLTSVTDLTLKVPRMSSCVGFNLQLPSLQRLTLEGVSVGWDQLENLTYFSLRCFSQWEHSPSVVQIYNLLSRCPNLEALLLDRLSPLQDESLQDISTPIPLLKLRELALSDSLPIVAAVSTRIRVGPQTRIQLYFSTIMLLRCVFPSRLPYLPGGYPNISCLRLDKNEGSLYCPTESAWPIKIPKAGSISFRSAFGIVSELTKDLRDVTNVVPIQTLELCSGVLSTFTHPQLKEFLWRMKGLTTLRVAFNDLGVLLQVLAAGGSKEEMICPNLRILSFGNLETTWFNFESTWMERILQCLLQRKTHDLPVDTLELGHFHREPAKTIEMFSGVVRNIDFLGGT